jgi:hypothetical protein
VLEARQGEQDEDPGEAEAPTYEEAYNEADDNEDNEPLAYIPEDTFSAVQGGF